jgi:multidrug efflux system membrane fusion protein
LLLDLRKNSTAIPAAAIQRGPQGTYVFAVKSDNTVEVRPVTVAFTQDNVSVIASGVSPNEVVVTDGQDKLQDGSKIETRPAAPSVSKPQQAASSNGSGSSSSNPAPSAQHSGTK